MDFLQLKNKTILITGLANKKSIAYFVAKTLQEVGCQTIFSVQNENNKTSAQKLFPEEKIYICDVEDEKQITALADNIKADGIELAGMLHSMAFANFSEGIKPFHETKTADFLQACNISCFSLANLSRELKDLFAKDASVVTVSISSTKATAYGYLGPIKATLDTTVSYLAKSFSEFSAVRFNAVCAGPLKTSASAGIPDYIDNYLYAEQLTLRKKALATKEVANTICFLLSGSSSGINGSNVIVDAGISSNYFDQDVVKTLVKGLY